MPSSDVRKAEDERPEARELDAAEVLVEPFGRVPAPFAGFRPASGGARAT